jgi:phthiocerol/phenolphthiocerol synthesis type-I polyketide synthase D
MFDTYPPAPERRPEAVSEHSVIHWLAPHLDLSLPELTALPPERQWERIAERAHLSSGIGTAEIRRLAEVCQAHLTAFDAYQPRPYSGRVVLFSAGDGEGPDPRWQAICPQLCVENVPGNHYTMLRPPHAAILANRLGVYLGKVAKPGATAGNP